MKPVITSLILVFLISLPPASALKPAPSKTTRAPQQSSTSSSVKADDRGWPRGYSLPSEAQVVLYQPQVASWDDQKHMVALAAVSYVAKGEQKPALGTLKIEADTAVSTEQRLVKFSSLKITETNFQ